MRDREYDIAFLEIKIRNDELEREWRLHKLGRRAEVLFNAEEISPRYGAEAAPDAEESYA